MADVSAHTDADRHPIIYAGGFVEQVASADLPSNCTVLGGQDAPPHNLTEALNRANTLVLLDPLSFPLEAMTGNHWDIPIIVVLPSELGAERLTTDLGSVLLERIGFFDRIVASHSVLWDELRRRYNWSESQRVPVTSDHLEEVTKAVCTLLEAESASPTASDGNGICRNLRCNKSWHRIQAAALEPWFGPARGERDLEIPFEVLEVGAGVGRWASSFDPRKTRFVGLDTRQDLVETARTNFPDHRFGHLGSDLMFPYEDGSFDLVFGVTAMCNHPAPIKRGLLSEMWRVTRPGGRLLFLEDFVFMKQPERPVKHPTSVTGFVDLVLNATAGQIVLEHMESLQYPGEDMHRGGLISLLRLGVPQ